MARIDTLQERLRRLRAIRNSVTDEVAKRRVNDAIRRTEKQIAKAAMQLGRPPRRNMRRTASGKFG